MSSNACVGARHGDLLRDNQRAAAELEDLPQRHQRAHAAAGAARRRADGKHAALEGGVGRLAAVARAREIQSMVFFRSGVTEALYSGLVMKTP